MADAIIDTRDLRKTYGVVDAVRGLDLRVSPGSICGFLGRNGSGKTTTMKMLLGMTRPTSGTATVFGLDATAPEQSVEIRRRTAFVSDDKDLYDSMTVGELVRFTASFFPGWRPDLEQRYLRTFGLPGERRVKALSRGMRTKLSLLLALCRGADLLMLDEPTSGLDPAAAEEVLQAIVSQVAERATTVFFSSHQIAEVEQIADEVAIIDRGRTVVSGSIESLQAGFRRVQLVFDGDPPAYAFAAPGAGRVQRSGRVLSVLSTGGTEQVLHEARALQPASIDVVDVTLKEIFLECVAMED